MAEILTNTGAAYAKFDEGPFVAANQVNGYLIFHQFYHYKKLHYNTSKVLDEYLEKYNWDGFLSRKEAEKAVDHLNQIAFLFYV